MQLGIKMTGRLKGKQKQNKKKTNPGSVFLDCSSGKGKEILNAF